MPNCLQISSLLQHAFNSVHRKLKNRVAAQTARDRKRNLMSDLELKVAELEQRNKRLAMENQKLKAQSGNLQKQNEQLKERLDGTGHESGKVEAGIGSAASVDLQQQGQTLPLSYQNMYTASMLTFIR